MRAADKVLIDLLASDASEEVQVVLIIDVLLLGALGHVDLADRGDESDDLDTVSQLEVALSDGTSSDTALRRRAANQSVRDGA